MKNILTTEEIKFLSFFCKYLRTYGLETCTFRIDSDWWDRDEFDLEDVDNLRSDENYYMEIPSPIFPIITKILNFAKTKERFPDEYEEVWGEIEFNCKDKTIDVYQNWREVHRRDESSMIDKEDLNRDPELTKLFDTLFKATNERKIVIPFNGYGDSGELEFPSNFPSDLEDFCYNYLENNYGGWEINEGSGGEFTFDLKKRFMNCEFFWNEEDVARKTLIEIKF